MNSVESFVFESEFFYVIRITIKSSTDFETNITNPVHLMTIHEIGIGYIFTFVDANVNP